MSTWDPPKVAEPSLPLQAEAPPRRGLKRRVFKLPIWGWLVALVGLFVVVGATADPEQDQFASVDSTSSTVEPARPSTTSPLATTIPRTAPATTRPVATQPPVTVPGGARALDVLQFIAIEKEHQEGYNRDLFAYPDDLDGDGCDTRDEVLVRDSLSPAQLDGNGCTAVAGDWYSAYDDATWTSPGEVEIDHVVALKEAWDSGAWAWDAGRQRQFGNDLDDVRTLRVVTAGLNSSKGDADPSNWIPPNDAAVCGYLADWIAIKVRWTLSMDESEHGRIRNLLTDRCPDQMIAPWLDAPPVTPPTTVPPTTVPPTTVPPTTVAPTTIATTPPPTQAPQPFIPPVVTTPPSADCDPSYPDFCLPPSSADTLNCADVPYTDFRVLPPDPHGFDGNNDGEGCES